MKKIEKIGIKILRGFDALVIGGSLGAVIFGNEHAVGALIISVAVMAVLLMTGVEEVKEVEWNDKINDVD